MNKAEKIMSTVVGTCACSASPSLSDFWLPAEVMTPSPSIHSSPDYMSSRGYFISPSPLCSSCLRLVIAIGAITAGREDYSL